ncbi:MAG: CPBP family intramembrane glutamic endopeptidase [Gemmataceae bacterium]
MTTSELKDEIVSFVRTHFDVMIVMATSAISLIGLHYYVIGYGLTGRPFSADFLWVLEQLGILEQLDLSPRLLDLIGWSFGCFAVYVVIPMTVLALCRKKPSEYGWNVHGLFGHMPIYLAMYIVVGIALVCVSFRKDFQNYYPFYKNPISWRELLIWEFVYALQFISLEFFFRGFLVHGLKEKLGGISAVCVMMFPYLMIHFGKPWLESMGAFIAGAILGTVSLRTGSIGGGAVVHIMVAWSMDLTALWQQGWFSKQIPW